MKKYLLIIVLISHLQLFSQNSKNREIQKIDLEIAKLTEQKDKGGSSTIIEAINASIMGLEQKKSNILLSLKTEKERIQQQNDDLNDLQKNNQNQIKQNQQNLNYQGKQNDLQQLKQQQADLSQRFSNELNNISNSMRNVMLADVRKNLMERQELISSFYHYYPKVLNKTQNSLVKYCIC